MMKKSLVAMLPKSPLGVGMGILIAISYGFSSGLIDYQSRSDQLPATAQSQSRKYTLLHYEKLSPGISLLEARTLVNDGMEIKRSATTVVIRWSNSDGSSITATFTNNKLTDKEHTL